MRHSFLIFFLSLSLSLSLSLPPQNAPMTALLVFLLEHADEVELDPAAMARLDKLVRLALAGQPEVQQILETQVPPQVGAEPAPKYFWSAETGFHRALSKEHVGALTTQLAQLVCHL